MTAAIDPLGATQRSVAVGGLGAIGYAIAEALDRGIEGFRLLAVSAKDLERARIKISHFAHPPRVVPAEALAEAQIVIEAAPASVFDSIATAAIERGRTLIVASGSALLSRMHLIDRARRSGAHIVVPSGALAGLDAIRAAAVGRIDSVTLVTRKPPAGFAGVAYLERQQVDVNSIVTETCLFRGNALGAAANFPANANVAAALALAGIGPERTLVEIWADPRVTHNTHVVQVAADSGWLTLQVQAIPSVANPRTSRIAAQSIIACLRGLHGTLKVGS